MEQDHQAAEPAEPGRSDTSPTTARARTRTVRPLRAARAALARRPLVVTGVAAGLVIALLAGLVIEAEMTLGRSDRAHAAGDCDEASAAVDGLRWWHRAVAPGPVEDAEQGQQACALLLDALASADPIRSARMLETYQEHPAALWAGAGPVRAERLLAVADGSAPADSGRAGDDPEALVQTAFEQLSDTVREHPEQAGRVREVAEAFVGRLAEHPEPCAARELTGTVEALEPDAEPLAAAVSAAADQVPATELGCARDLAQQERFTASRKAYRDLLDQYGKHDVAVVAATELAEVELQIVSDSITEGAYCANPAAYPQAPAFQGPGPHPMRVLGLDARFNDFPGGWLADQLGAAELVVCVGGPTTGKFQQFCTFSADNGSGQTTLFFHASKFRIRAYSLRTGKLVQKYTRQIGTPCPSPFYFPGVSQQIRSNYTPTQARAMFTPLQK